MPRHPFKPTQRNIKPSMQTGLRRSVSWTSDWLPTANSSTGPFSEYDNSPTKAHTLPRLQSPSVGQTYLFSQPPASKPLPPTPWSKNPAFTTPRKPNNEIYSSDIEPSTSPENNIDSDASPVPTNMGARSGLAKAGTVLARTLSGDTKSRRDPSPTRLNATSGKGEISRRMYSTAVEKRVRQRRKKEGGRALSIFRKSSADSDSEGDQSKRAGKDAGSTGSVAAVLRFINEHPGLPHTLAYWCQLFFNMLFGSAIIYLAYCTWSTIRSDVDKKSEEAMTAIYAEIALCAKSFQDNGCSKPPPALETVCSNWQKCMDKNPLAVGRAKVSAHTFAEIFNSFMEPISFKAMVSTLSQTLLIF